MAYSKTITQFAQQVYLTIKNRYYDDIESDDGQIYISQVIDWTNLFLGELENTVDLSGNPVYWKWLRQQGYDLGTVQEGDTDILIDPEVMHVIPYFDRKAEIRGTDGKVLSRWDLVTPDQISEMSWRYHYSDQVCQVGDTLLFNRPIKDIENDGNIFIDVVTYFPKISGSNTEVLTIVKPKQLLVLGVAKNSTLPDIVQGGLSPSYVQKYTDLLQNAISINNASSISDHQDRSDFSYISGVGF